MSINHNPLIEKVDLLLAELQELNTTGPHFKIVHRFRHPCTECASGEEVAAVYLVYRGREVFVRLPLALRMLFDYLARHQHLPQSASQIEAGIRTDLFYVEHGCNATTSTHLTRGIARSAVKEYVKRTRRALALAFRDADFSEDPLMVLVSESTVSNEVVYWLKASVEWYHDIVR